MIVLLVFLAVIQVNASSVIGSVELVSGSAKVKSEDSLKKKKLFVGLEISRGDLVTTSRDAKVLIKLLDGTSVIMDKNSIVHFISLNLTEQKDGKVYYKVRSRDAKNSLKIKTSFAIIGIKGTTFIVEAGRKASVKLKEGLIDVESVKGKFELYRKKVQKQFEDFMRREQSAFEEYKQSQRPGFVEITDKFELQAGQGFSFDDNKVKEYSWTKEDEYEFDKFEKLMQFIE